MKTLTADTFKEVFAGNSLVMFFKGKGCPNCDKTKPIMQSFKKPGVNTFCIDAEANRSIVETYAPATNWNLPLVVYLENGEVTATSTGVQTRESLHELTKTLQNISDVELQGLYAEMDLKRASIKLEEYKVALSLSSIIDEMKRRETAAAGQPAPTVAAPTAPEIQEAIKKAIADKAVAPAAPAETPEVEETPAVVDEAHVEEACVENCSSKCEGDEECITECRQYCKHITVQK